MRHNISSITKPVSIVVLSLALVVGSVFVGAKPAGAHGSDVIFFDNFKKLKFKDQTPYAKWFRYVNAQGEPDDPQIAKYKKTDDGLRLEVNTKSVDGNYSNAEISTSPIGDGNSPFLRFGVDTRVEVRMKYDPKMKTSFLDPGTALGSAGLLYWNYSTIPGDLEEEGSGEGGIGDAFGFSWQESRSSLPGFFAIGLVDGQFALAQPLPDVEIEKYNTYAIERRHTSVKYFINGAQIAEIPINQPGAPTLPDDKGLAADMWVDNASHQYEVDGDELIVSRAFYHLPANQTLDIKYVKITSLD